ncbi:hypothetical protein [Streptomyces sp. SLBN-115]|uniref:hypothetical protein n=1 Tax=Streptomyces sp. SLBN-115 TaxID=2768453 RepID=UPI00114DABB1|nr:hypothetical protein [Streptomyces sp. SLBN-115]TQJ46405.1 hypothetical protein FBY34_5789 [Streptomyces sp. SLBN-115]
MNHPPRKSRRRPGAVRAVVLGVCAAGALSLTGCSGDGGTAGAGSEAKPSATTAIGTGAKTGADADTTGKKPGTAASTGAGSGVKSPSVVPVASKPPAPTATKSAGAEGDADDCDHKMPISPDEIAVYRYTPEGGSLSLIVKYGNWGCGSPDSDGAPFETVGEETYIPMDQAAYVTVTNPIVESTENQPIGVQEFLDWLEAHPNSGLVFTYHLDSSGAIDRLDEVFTP